MKAIGLSRQAVVRQAVRHCLLIVLAISLGWRQHPAHADAPVGLGGSKHVFIDEMLIGTASGAVLTVNPPQVKELAIIADRPWERHGLPASGTVVHDPKTGEDLLYYYGLNLDVEQAWSLCLAVSKDGVHWEKPNLGAVEWKGSRENNIVARPAEGGTVMIDPNGTPERRFVNLGRRLATSAEGRHWTTHRDPIVGEDLLDSQIGTFWDDEHRLYVHLARFNNHSAKLLREVRYHTTQKLDEVWSHHDTLPVVMSGDADDPPGTDLYTNAATKYAGAPGTYLAFPTPYYHYDFQDRAYLNKPALDNGGKANDGKIETQLAVSRDGKNWKRYRTPYLRLMSADGLDLKIVMALCGLVYRENTIDQYFAGYTFTHGDTQARRQKEGRSLGGIWRSQQRRDGFTSLDFEYKGGEVVTRPFTFEGNRLRLNVNTSAAGEARVAILDAEGQELPPFTLANSRMINGDYIDVTASWGTVDVAAVEDVASLSGRPVRLKFSMRGAKLYAFQFTRE